MSPTEVRSGEQGRLPVPWDVKVLIVKEVLIGAANAIAGPFNAEFMNGQTAMFDVRGVAFFSTMVSSFSLVGTVVFGRASDRFSRKGILLLLNACSCGNALLHALNPEYWFTAGLAGSLIAAGIACVTKAVTHDHSIATGASPADTAQWLAVAQAVCGIAGAVGPAISPLILSNREQALFLIFALDVVCYPCIFLLRGTPKKAVERRWTLRDFLDLKSMRSPGGLFFLGWVFLMVMIFNVCQTILGPLLRHRFNPDAQMYGMLQSMQGIGIILGTTLSAPLVRYFCPQRPQILLSSFMMMTIIARMLMFWTSSWQQFLVAHCVFAVFGIGVIGPIRNSIPH
eukprot:TRINITY_DN87464_c0_g1_i1.p1 TRINITY_DN87464_c0_g1~~TRINITY_DN87464_c0_g1_i1.p1  ORF type:complete len:341 (+),score=36.14 TRINITY_DN87464_c0_g1_i1:252-1274(+)